MLPLNGVKVVELAQNIAGPYAGQILATLGADVVKIERPQGGDDARGWGVPLTSDASHVFHIFNYNKRGAAIDLTDAAALTWLKSYLAGCDVLVQNMRPGAMEALGLDADTLRSANPRLIYCSLGAFGSTGPMRMKPGYEPIVQAFAGIFAVNGTPEGPPTRVGLQVLDMGSGMWTAMGCIAALYRREMTGVGCVVDTSLFETALGWLALSLSAHRTLGLPPARHRTGSPRLIVFQGFETKDGEVVVAAANNRLFAKFADAVGRPEWKDDPRFATNALRVANSPTLLPQIEDLMHTRSCAEWVRCFDLAGIPCAPINDLAGVAREPQTRAVEMLQSIPSVKGEFVRLPLKFDGARPPIRHAAPALGEHNAELGITPLRRGCPATATRAG